MDNQIIFSPIPKSELFDFIKTAVSEAVSNRNTADLSDELINREQLKEYTGISSDVTVMRLERLGVFKPIRLGRRMMYRKHEVKATLDKLQNF